jgi:hypothetical protein
MKALIKNDLKKISGGVAMMQIHGGQTTFTTTGSSVNYQASNINGIKNNMILYNDHVTDLNDNTIFEGTKGSFCHTGNAYKVSPVTNGAQVTYVGQC